ncbi:MAG: hypothetical protein ACR2QU_05060 [Gammaproteobacteria bacterium]
MLLRRLTQHINDQNWFAVGLDFAIVVVGVFIGIQVANWNDARAFDGKEKQLLIELKREIEAASRITDSRREAYLQVLDSAKRAIAYLDSDQSCGSECWPVLVDFFHASQWRDVDVNRSTYDEMRRMGLPRSRAIVDEVGAYLAQNENTASVMIDKPVYRTHVRSLMPLEVHDAYWSACYVVHSNGEEVYVRDCPKGVSDDVAARAVEAIVQDPDTRKYLTFWYSEVVPTPSALEEQGEAALRAIAAIDAELKAR